MKEVMLHRIQDWSELLDMCDLLQLLRRHRGLMCDYISSLRLPVVLLLAVEWRALHGKPSWLDRSDFKLCLTSYRLYIQEICIHSRSKISIPPPAFASYDFLPPLRYLLDNAILQSPLPFPFDCAQMYSTPFLAAGMTNTALLLLLYSEGEDVRGKFNIECRPRLSSVSSAV